MLNADYPTGQSRRRLVVGVKRGRALPLRWNSRGTARAISLFLFALLTACANEGRRDVAAVSIFGKACPECSESVRIDRAGRFEELEPHGLAAFDRRAADIAIRTLPLDELRRADRIGPLRNPAPVVIVAVTYRDGREERAPVPVGETASDGIEQLQRWTQFESIESSNIVSRDRRRSLSDSFRRGDLHAVALESLGCYGSCPRYVASFAANGIATIHRLGRRCAITARAIVPFHEVLEAASMAGAERLRPYYAIRAEDTFGARITFVTLTNVFVSYAPDRTSWGPEFLATESRLDQIVRDVHWAPALNLRRCAE